MGRLLFLLLISIPSRAQLQFHTLNEVLRYADKHSTVSAKAPLLEEVSRLEMKAARSSLKPQVNLIADANYYPVISSLLVPDKMLGGTDSKLTKVQLGLPFAMSAGIEATIPVIAFDKWAVLKKAQMENVRTHFTEKAKLERLHIELTQAYFEILAMKELLELNKENTEAISRLMVVMDARKKEGVLDPAAYNSARNLQLETEHTYWIYTGLQKQHLIKLKSLMNIPQEDSIMLVQSLPGFTQQVIQLVPVSKRAAAQESAMKVLVARQTLSISEKASLPKLYAFGRYATNYQMRFGSHSQQVHFDASTVGVRLDIPLLAGRYYKTQRFKNNLLVKSAEADQEDLINKLREEQAIWKNGYQTAVMKQSSLEKKVMVNADNLRIANAQLKEGVMEFEQYNTIFLEFNKARLDQIQNLFDGLLYAQLLRMPDGQ
ncbi:MAG TPA: TolC family protein [Flavitalea sp.]|nr:TolC family protein [Flavitalea sp.]